MTPLRQRMIDDMRLAGFAERTRDVYIQAVRRIAAHYMRSPDVLSEEEVRAYLLHLRDERGVARGTFKTNHGGIRFLYGNFPCPTANCSVIHRTTNSLQAEDFEVS